jgi:serine/threonine protein kinase
VTTGTERLYWTLQQYSIGHLIASGHFGVVYHARHQPTGRDVALKLIPLQGQDSEEKVAAERHGAVLQQRFGNAYPGLVPSVYEHQTIVPFYAIAMELVHGQQLSQIVAEGPLPPMRAAATAFAIATFLDRAHRFETEIEHQRYARIVHADLKPDHILLVPDGIRVLDFGIAKALSTRTLVTTNRWGSIQYSSPERLQSDGHVNEQADFWSLGVILFEMLAGYRPYRRHETNPGLLDQAIRRQDVREPLPPGANPVLAAIVHKLLAPQIERRYQSAEAIARDLDAFLHGRPTTAGLQQVQAGQETVRLTAAPRISTAPRPAQTVPTEPLPVQAPATPHGGVPSSAPPRTAAPSRQTPRQPGMAMLPPLPGATRLARLAVLALLILIVAIEAMALVRAERLRTQIPTLEFADLPRVREQFDRIDLWTPLGIGSARLSNGLRARLVELAEQVILEFRMEQPAVAQAQWESARESLDLALRLNPGDRAIAAMRSTVRGHLERIAGRSREAILLFREASRFEPRSPDPYLGLASVYAYATHDLDGLTAAVREAERRGYRPNRRERAEFGDLHKTLADRARGAAARAIGVVRLEQLQRAAADYKKCVEYFDGLRLFNSEAHLRDCRRRLGEIDRQLPAAEKAATMQAAEL